MREIEELYKLFKQDVYRYLIYLTRDPDASEDLLSETFVNAISSIKSFKGKSSVKTWLFSIARNTWLQRLRKERKTLEYNDFLELYVSGSIDDQVITNERVKRIRELLLEKDERTQRVVNMRIEGYSYAEISEKVNVSENSARVIDYRTKKWIRESLEMEGLK